MNQLRNVHVYDGTLGQHYTKVHNLSKQEKIDIFGKFSEKLSHPLASRMIQIIIFDLNYPKSGEFTNKDNKNSLDCTDILGDICKKLEENSEIDIDFIQEQIVDIFRLGQCAQGRTTRFLQIWNAIKDA